MRTARKPIGILTSAAVVLATSLVLACPFCQAPNLTLSEQIGEAGAVVLAKWVKGVPPKGTSGAVAAATAGGEVSIPPTDAPVGKVSTTFEIVEVVKSGSAAPAKGETLTLAGYTPGKPGDMFLLLATQGTPSEWSLPMQIDETSASYVRNLPGPDKPAQERLRYFMEYLEFPDRFVAADAYGEFARADYKDVVAIKDELPLERVRQWVANKETDVTRLGFYGLLLGLAGTADDAKLMEAKITEPTEDFRIGIDGIMGGYLLLKGEEGLDVLVRTKIDKQGKAPFSETYAAMQALRFMWTYGDGQISRDRLKQSMRKLLERPELADLAIADLSRWKDWGVQDRLVELYDAEAYDLPPIKRAIVKYLLIAQLDKEEGQPAPEHVASAKAHLEALRAKDPETVKAAERFFVY